MRKTSLLATILLLASWFGCTEERPAAPDRPSKRTHAAQELLVKMGQTSHGSEGINETLWDMLEGKTPLIPQALAGLSDTERRELVDPALP